MLVAAQRFGGVLGCFVVIFVVGACDGARGSSGGDAGAAGAPSSDASGGAGAALGGTGGTPPSADAAPAPTPDASVEANGGAGAPPMMDAAAAPDAVPTSSLPKNVLIFTRSTNAYVHESKLPAAMAIKAALAPLGVTGELSEDVGVFTAARLAPFGAIVLVDTTGKPLGDPGTAALDALAAFVKAGGGLVGIHAATATTYDVTLPYVPLLGGLFVAHPNDVHTTTCFPKGAHPSVTQLPPSFSMLDEIFTFTNLRADNEVVVECLATDGKTRLPIAWHHAEGAGRVFNTAFGHPLELWTPDGLLLKQHVLPGILWTLGL
jgi:uncharacterized protein